MRVPPHRQEGPRRRRGAKEALPRVRPQLPGVDGAGARHHQAARGDLGALRRGDARGRHAARRRRVRRPAQDQLLDAPPPLRGDGVDAAGLRGAAMCAPWPRWAWRPTRGSPPPARAPRSTASTPCTPRSRRSSPASGACPPGAFPTTSRGSAGRARRAGAGTPPRCCGRRWGRGHTGRADAGSGGSRARSTRRFPCHRRVNTALTINVRQRRPFILKSSGNEKEGSPLANVLSTHQELRRPTGLHPDPKCPQHARRSGQTPPNTRGRHTPPNIHTSRATKDPRQAPALLTVCGCASIDISAHPPRAKVPMPPACTRPASNFRRRPLTP